MGDLFCLYCEKTRCFRTEEKLAGAIHFRFFYISRSTQCLNATITSLPFLRILKMTEFYLRPQGTTTKCHIHNDVLLLPRCLVERLCIVTWMSRSWGASVLGTDTNDHACKYYLQEYMKYAPSACSFS